jgi:hypothetical protein
MHIPSRITATFSACTGPTTHWRRGSSITIDVIELPDPPSHEQERGLIRNNVQMANLYLPNFSAPQTRRSAHRRRTRN